MEKENTIDKPTLKTYLGYDSIEAKEYGIINEYEAYIHRRAYDYLMVGFCTDVDQIEEDRESRFRAHVMRIGLDLSSYWTDVQEWNTNHSNNANPATWQLQPDEDGRMVRRIDLPSVEVCRESIIPESHLNRNLTWQDLENIAHEGISKHFDRALTDSYQLLRQKQEDITAELPTAPYEEYDAEVKTRQQLIEEYTRNVSRLSAIEHIYMERNPVDTADNLASLQPELPGSISPITEKIYVVRSLGKTTANLIHTA